MMMGLKILEEKNENFIQEKDLILLIEDNKDCLEECAEIISTLGYECLTSEDPVMGLRLIASNPEISIVVTDIDMPILDGVALLQEVSSRFARKRSISAIAITGIPSLDMAVSAMRSSAMDFLSKPIDRGQLALALRRASLKNALESDRARMRAFTYATRNRQIPKPPVTEPEVLRKEAKSATVEALASLVRNMIKSRQARFDFLGDGFCSDPSWDILLELTHASLKGEPTPSSSACAATNAPMTTALRHIGKLVEAGYVKRWSDPNHGRRVLLELTPAAQATMTAYLQFIASRQTEVSTPPIQ